MKVMRLAWLVALVVPAVLAAPAEARRVVVMPTQYFSSDPDSAAAVTVELTRQFRARGFDVPQVSEARAEFKRRNLSYTKHYPDSVAVRFGRALRGDLVVYSRILAQGVQVQGETPTAEKPLNPAAVILVRVIDTRTRRAVYANQISQEIGKVAAETAKVRMSGRDASLATQRVLKGFKTRSPRRSRR